MLMSVKSGDVDTYPEYARSERIADGTMHALGVAGALIGAGLLVSLMFKSTPVQMAGLAIYAAALIGTFAASAFYHMTPWEHLRPVLRRFDHAAIYLKIAGTYTPLVVLIGTGFAYVVLGLVWVLAIAGITRKLIFWRTPGRFDPLLYLAMGWMSLALVWGLVPVMPSVAMVLIGAGGALYTCGVVFYSWESLKFSNAIWHGFVLVASTCFFAAIVLGTSVSA